MKIFSRILLKKIASLITIREIEINTYNTSEYIRLKIYLLEKNKNNITLIKREFYVINNLTIKVLININIIKLEEIVIDIVRNLIIIDLYKNLKISIISFN